MIKEEKKRKRWTRHFYSIPSGPPPIQYSPDYTVDTAMQGFWNLEEASGDRIDGSGKGNNLNSINNVGQSSNAKQGSYSASFSRASSQSLGVLDASLSANFPGKNGLPAQNLTAGCWIYPTSVSPQIWAIGKDDSFWILVIPSGNIRAQLSAGASYPESTSNNTYPVNAWQHAVIRFFGTTTRELNLFVNGVKQTSAPIAATGVMASNRGFYIGASSFASNFFDGLVDEAFVMNRALSDAEILNIYSHGLNGRRA